MKVNTGKYLVGEQSSAAKAAHERAKIARFHQAKITRTMKFLESVTKSIPEADATCYSWLNIDTWQAGSEKITIQVNINAVVKSMKEGLVPQLLRILMNAGFDTSGTRDYCSEYSGSREFTLFRPSSEDHVRMNVEFQATVSKEADATCRKVQVGTKIQEVPVYKLECPDATPEEIAVA